jgi:hypothetical protein
MKKTPIDSSRGDELVSGPRLIRKRRTKLNVVAFNLGIDSEGLLDSILINYLKKSSAALKRVIRGK